MFPNVGCRRKVLIHLNTIEDKCFFERVSCQTIIICSNFIRHDVLFISVFKF